MKRSRESNPSSQSYERIKDSLKHLLRMAEYQTELGETAKAKSLIAEAIEGARVKPLISSSVPSADVALRSQSFNELTNLALVFGKAGSLLEEHDDRLAIDYFNHSMVTWNQAWNELDELTSRWDLTLEEVVQDDDFDCDYSLSYAFRIAECFKRLGEWQQVISAVDRSIELSGEDYHHYELLSDAYDELGDYDSCIVACEKVRIHWYEKDDTEKELAQICRMAVISECHDKPQEAIRQYDKFADYYYRCEHVAGRIEFNKACLLIQCGDLGRAYVALHSSLRFFARDKKLNQQDLIRCEDAIASLQAVIASGADSAPSIEPFTIVEICDVV